MDHYRHNNWLIHWRLFVFRLGAIALVEILFSSQALAEITPDTTLGAEQSLLQGTMINGGARRGANLFHSFRDFNVAEGQQVYFVGDFGIRNIISRVTGTSPSVIRGLLGVSDFSANLFLINPNGIVIGPGAALDIAGAFVATTANAMQFGSQGTFSASNPTTPPLLTIDPSALLFNQNTPPAPITLQNSVLNAFPGTSLLMIGGNVSLTNVELQAPAGRIELGGLNAPGTIELSLSDDFFGNTIQTSFPTGVERSDVLISGSELDVSIPSESYNFGGDIALTGRNIEILGNSVQRSYVLSGITNLVQTTDGRAGDIILNATSTITIADASVSSGVQFRAIGNGGNIDITTGSLILKQGGYLDSSSAGVGLGGNITIRANELVQVDGQFDNGISSTIGSRLNGSLPAIPDAGVGRGGDITIHTRSLQLINGGTIEANAAFGTQGRAGNVTINAQDAVEIDGTTQPPFSTERFASGILTSLSDEAIGTGGNISITSRLFSLTNGGILRTSSSAQGNAGDVVLTTQTATLDGNHSGIFSSLDSNAIGAGGNISLTLNTLTISNHAQISADTQGQGDAGNINLVANSLDMTNGGQFRTSTSTAGAAGDIRLKISDRASLTGTESGLFANTIAGSSGNGGTIFVDSNALTLQNWASISTDSQGTGTGGSIAIQVNSLQLDDRAAISAETVSNTGGNINLNVSNLLLLRRGSSISTTAGTSQGEGNGGNINLVASFIVAVPGENSDITANAFRGNGGNINITTQGIFGIAFRDRVTPFSDITASSQFGLAGVVNITTLRIDPVQGAIALPAAFSVPPLAEGCNAQGRQSSRFITTGRGGIPTSPTAPLTADTLWQDWDVPFVSAQSKPDINRLDTNRTAADILAHKAHLPCVYQRQ